jgi:hypothetical protein
MGSMTEPTTVLAPAAGEGAVGDVGDAGVEEEGEGVCGHVVEDEVAGRGGGEQAREGEQVGEGVDVLVSVESGEAGQAWSLGGGLVIVLGGRSGGERLAARDQLAQAVVDVEVLLVWWASIA